MTQSCPSHSSFFISSAVFVPKEVIKQHMQYVGGNAMGRAIKDIVQKHGIRGLYSGYSVRKVLW